MCTSTKPPPSRRSCRRPSSPSTNGPGASGSGGGAWPSSTRMRPAIVTQGLRWPVLQTARARATAGPQDAARLRDGRLGIGHEHVSRTGRGRRRRSRPRAGCPRRRDWRCSTFRSPSSAARRRATSTMADEKSLEMRRPLLAQERSGREARVARPRRELEHGVARLRVERSTIHSVTGRVVFSISARRRSQPDAIVCQFSSAVRLYSLWVHAGDRRRQSHSGRLARLEVGDDCEPASRGHRRDPSAAGRATRPSRSGSWGPRRSGREPSLRNR